MGGGQKIFVPSLYANLGKSRSFQASKTYEARFQKSINVQYVILKKKNVFSGIWSANNRLTFNMNLVLFSNFRTLNVMQRDSKSRLAALVVIENVGPTLK